VIKIKDILAIVVLYKQKLSNSATYVGLEEALNLFENERLDVFVYDNSPQKFEQDAIPFSIGKFNIKYERNVSNAGVSLAYNKGAEYARALGKKWLLLFDQDSIVSNNFLFILLQSMNFFTQEHLFVPRLVDRGLQLSPCRYYFAKGFPYKKELTNGVYSIARKNLLNSCICIRLDVFLQLGGYFENIPLYYSDFVFIDKYRKYFKTFVLIDASIQHKMAALSTNLEQRVKTYELFCIGAKGAAKAQPKYRFYYFINTSLRGFVLILRNRKIAFLRAFIRNFW
jgi:GT2 family glycosyltransferase